MITFVCDYQSYSDQTGNHPVETEFVLTFVIDTEAGKTLMVGNNGTEEVTGFAGKDTMSFVEVTATKNINATTIASDGSSVHSRNVVIFGELVPSQFYGTCVSK